MIGAIEGEKANTWFQRGGEEETEIDEREREREKRGEREERARKI